MLKKIPEKYSFKLVSLSELKNLSSSKDSLAVSSGLEISPETIPATSSPDQEIDNNKRNFLKIAGIAGLGLVASQILPKKADALIMGSTPSSSVVGIKDDTNTRINPATEETLTSLLTGQGVTKLTTSLAASGNVRTPASGKKIRVYASRFSLTADATSVSFRFTAGGTDYEKYLAPKTGGLYGSNNHPNYVEGGVDEVLYCNIAGTTTVQINIDYLEV
ncbi:MAG: hypothetical protein K8Q91_02225 [Candidatus Vogelbacteria bacterium]|nr:hypothetical protein [Candidatus Vogelbacteria bacterium]